MVTKSKVDLTLFFCNLLLFSIFAFAFSIPFWQTDFFDKVANNSTKHILLALGYLLIFIFLPLFALSWSTTMFVVYEGKINVINWFGIKRKVYLLPFSKNLIVKKETAPYSFRFFPINSRYNKYQTLYLSTVEGRKLRIQSRYYKNFEELCSAIRKECLKNTSQIKAEQNLKRTSE